jgi:hypothetical protein
LQRDYALPYLGRLADQRLKDLLQDF